MYDNIIYMYDVIINMIDVNSKYSNNQQKSLSRLFVYGLYSLNFVVIKILFQQR